MRIPASFLLFVLTSVACGSGGSRSSDGGTRDAGGVTDAAPAHDAPASDGGTRDAGGVTDATSGLDAPVLDAASPADARVTDAGAGDPDGGAAALPALCLESCQAPADCVLAGSAYDEDNYACASGVCIYTGCVSDAECQADLGPAYRCRPNPLGVPACFEACSAPVDCIIPGGARFDEDNYACTGGACVYTGCVSDAECQADLGSGYVCRPNALGVRDCVETCSAPVDCIIPGGARFDEDNYACTGGACVYTGCVGDAECQADLGSSYVCTPG
jgi:hypothetical protein